MYNTILDFIKTFFRNNKKNNLVSTSNTEELQNIFSEKMKELSLKKEIAKKILNSNDFKDFQENFVDVYLSLQIKKMCDSKDDKEIYDISRRIAGIFDLFTDLKYNSNIDIEKMSNDFKESIEKRTQFEKIYFSEDK